MSFLSNIVPCISDLCQPRQAAALPPGRRGCGCSCWKWRWRLWDCMSCSWEDVFEEREENKINYQQVLGKFKIAQEKMPCLHHHSFSVPWLHPSITKNKTKQNPHPQPPAPHHHLSEVSMNACGLKLCHCSMVVSFHTCTQCTHTNTLPKIPRF